MLDSLASFAVEVGGDNFFAEAFDAFAIGILGLAVAEFGFVAHADVPFTEGQADLRLVEGFDTEPLPEAAPLEDAPFSFCTPR